ncbi:transposase [Kribbella deserti]|uniref:Transposase n=1 Tax=Kribbella deserti TaxID=1926257 RepID=A0ABV6QXL6_9ACTN
MVRILDLYDHPPADGRVICADEFGPLNLQPRPGRGGQMFYRFRNRKRWREFLGFLKQLRDSFPAGKLYVVCDNYEPHKKADVIEWCRPNGVELVFTPATRPG